MTKLNSDKYLMLQISHTCHNIIVYTSKFTSELNSETCSSSSDDVSVELLEEIFDALKRTHVATIYVHMPVYGAITIYSYVYLIRNDYLVSQTLMWSRS